MKLDDIKTTKIPFTLYDLFGYLLPGLFFFALFPITHDFVASLRIFENILLDNMNFYENDFLIIKIRNIISISPWLLTVYILLIAYLMGHIIAAFSSIIFERIIIQKFLKFPAANLFGIRTYDGKIENGFKFIASKFPKTVKNLLFGNYRRIYSIKFIEKFKEKFTQHFEIEPINQSDIFWLTFSYVSQSCPATFQRASHFLNLYGFSRNLSMTFFLFSVVLFILELFNGVEVEYLVILVYLFISLIFFWQYLKFFRRLNDEVYRGFIAEPK